MELAYIIILIVSPILSVIITEVIQKQKIKRLQKVTLFTTLIMNQNRTLSEGMAKILNLVNVVFYNNEGIIKISTEYYNCLSNDELSDEAGKELKNKKYNELINIIAEDIGYNKKNAKADISSAMITFSAPKSSTSSQDIVEELQQIPTETKSPSSLLDAYWADSKHSKPMRSRSHASSVDPHERHACEAREQLMIGTTEPHSGVEINIVSIK